MLCSFEQVIYYIPKYIKYYSKIYKNINKTVDIECVVM